MFKVLCVGFKSTPRFDYYGVIIKIEVSLNTELENEHRISGPGR
jgi:hypothetical protein